MCVCAVSVLCVFACLCGCEKKHKKPPVASSLFDSNVSALCAVSHRQSGTRDLSICICVSESVCSQCPITKCQVPTASEILNK